MSTIRRIFASRAARVVWAFVFFLFASSAPTTRSAAVNRAFEFETNEVTQPALTVAADGRSLVFNLVGHLFRLPAGGGSATQLTFGPYYDSEPRFSPDGTRLAFISNRDGSDGNIFVMELASGRISQLTRDYQAGAPVWSPDGKTIAYVSYLRREEYPAGRAPGFGGGGPVMGRLSTIAATGGEARRLTEARAFGPIFYLADGRLAWLNPPPPQMPRPGAPPAAGGETTIDAIAADGAVSRFGAVPGSVGAIALTAKRDGFYFISGGNLRQYNFGEREAKVVGAFAGAGARMDIAADGQTLYAAADAKLWRVNLPGGAREQIVWNARVKMETATRAVKKWVPASSPTVAISAVLTPRISPDGRTLVFMAAGMLWEQPMNGGQAKRLIEEDAYQLEPAFSPDGKQLAFVSDLHGKREVRVYDFATRRTRTIASVPGASWALFPSWSGDGKSIVFQRTDGISDPYRFVRVNAQDGGAPVELAQTRGSWTGRPHFSADGGALYYTARVGVMANVYRLALSEGAKPEAVTDLARHAHDALVSPDGKWLAFRRNSEIWLAPMGAGVLKDQAFHRFSAEGGRSFAFTPDSAAIVYSEGAHIWRKQVQASQVTEIPLRLTLPRATPAPLLISRVRVLDLKAGKFSDETSMLIERGRIRWIGAENGRAIPANVVRIDGGGRYAIPGLTDSHTHTAWANQQITEDSLIAYGITSVRDTGSRLDIINALRDRGEATGLPVPRYFASGDIFEGLMPLWGDAFLEIHTKEEARDYVRRVKDQGATFIKVYASLPWYLKSEVAAEANRLGMPTVGHGLSLEEIVRSINFGITSLEHNAANTNDDIVKLLAASGTILDPTITIFGQGTPTMLADPEMLDAKFRTFIPEDAIKAARPGRAVTDAQRKAWLEATLAPIRKKHEAGIKLLDGTDALMTSVFHGPSVHWSLQFFSWGGIPAIDVLRMGTSAAAESVGASADLGTLEAGKIGDVLLLDADPQQAVRNTLKIWRVIKGGHVFDPATMRK